ncbi:hypothetical protein ACFL4L_07740 [bacterium]
MNYIDGENDHEKNICCVGYHHLRPCSRLLGRPPDQTLAQDSLVIGPGGGVFELENFKLVVPPGAFDTDQELIITISPSEGEPFAENSITDLIEIEGIPLYYEEPLHVVMKYNGQLSEESWIAVGEPSFITDFSTMENVYLFYDATDSAGYLICDIPANPVAMNKPVRKSYNMDRNFENPYLLWMFLGFTGKHVYKSEHFAFYTPRTEIDNDLLRQVGEYMEAAYKDIFEDFGFRYDARTVKIIPVSVLDLTSIDPYGQAFCSFSKKGHNYSVLAIQEDNVIQTSRHIYLRSLVAHEFFHLVQGLYGARPQYENKSVNEPYIWLMEASSVWCEEVFSDEVNYLSSVFLSNFFRIFEGLQPDPSASKDEHMAHGYGMATMIKYIVSRYGLPTLLKMYEMIRDEGCLPVDAVLNSIEDPPSVWFGDMYREFILCNIYPLGKLIWLTYYHDSIVINKETTAFQFEHSYRDFSARLYRLSLDPDLGPSMNMSLSLSGGDPVATLITVFENNQNDFTIQEIAVGFNHVTVTDIKALADRKSRLLILVTHAKGEAPYTHTTDITLKGEIVVTSQDVPYNRGYVALTAFPYRFTRDYTDLTKENGDFHNTIYWVSNTAERKEKNGEFYGDWDFTDQYGHHFGEMTAIFLGDPPDKLKEVTVTETTVRDWGTEHISLTAGDMDLYYADETQASFEATHDAAIDKIIRLNYIITESGWEDTLYEWYNDNYSTVGLRFHFWTEED